MRNLQMKPLKSIVVVISFLTLGAAFCPILRAEPDPLNSQIGMVQISVQGENGIAAADAPVYIRDSHKKLIVVKCDASGQISLKLQEGHYAFSSAVTRPIADSLDRYVSPTADIVVTSKDTTTVVLSLHLADDAIANLSPSAMKRIGITDDVAKDVNNSKDINN